MILYRFTCTGEYHKYDLIAYPQSTNISKSFVENMKDQALDLLSTFSGGLLGKRKGKSDPQELPEAFQPLSHKEMTLFGLKCYLQKFEKILRCGMFSDGLDIPSVATEINNIYKSLCVEHINPITTEQHGRVLSEAVNNQTVRDVSPIPVLWLCFVLHKDHNI